MERYRIFLLLPFLGGCTQASAPCPTAPRVLETAVLIATIMPPNAPPVSYQREFASMPACEAAKRELRTEMDGATVRAKNAVLNARPPQQGWTDYRGLYRPIMTVNDHSYPDLVALCADHGAAASDTGQTSGLATLPSGADLPRAIVQSEASGTPAAIVEPPQPQPQPQPPIPVIVTPIIQPPASPQSRRW